MPATIKRMRAYFRARRAREPQSFVPSRTASQRPESAPPSPRLDLPRPEPPRTAPPPSAALTTGVFLSAGSFVSFFDYGLRIPTSTIEHFNETTVERADVGRNRGRSEWFRADQRIPKAFRITRSAKFGDAYNRSHAAAAGNVQYASSPTTWGLAPEYLQVVERDEAVAIERQQGEHQRLLDRGAQQASIRRFMEKLAFAKLILVLALTSIVSLAPAVVPSSDDLSRRKNFDGLGLGLSFVLSVFFGGNVQAALCLAAGHLFVTTLPDAVRLTAIGILLAIYATIHYISIVARPLEQAVAIPAQVRRPRASGGTVLEQFTRLTQTYILSNALPMHRDLDNGYWADLEVFVRSLAIDFQEVRSITMPVFRPTRALNNVLMHSHPCIETSSGEITVPNYFAKVIIAVGPRGNLDQIRNIEPSMRLDEQRVRDEGAAVAADLWAAGVIVVPNEGVARHLPLSGFFKTLEEFEGMTPMNFPIEWKDSTLSLRNWVDLGAFRPIRNNAR